MCRALMITLLIILCAIPYVSFAEEKWYHIGTDEIDGKMYLFNKTKCFFSSKTNMLVAIERIVLLNQQSKKGTIMLVSEMVKMSPERRHNFHIDITNVMYVDRLVEYAIFDDIIHKRSVRVQFVDNKENLLYDTGTLHDTGMFNSKFKPIKRKSIDYTSWVKEFEYAQKIE